MNRRVLVAGILGFVVLFVWTELANVVFGFTVRREEALMRRILATDVSTRPAHTDGPIGGIDKGPSSLATCAARPPVVCAPIGRTSGDVAPQRTAVTRMS
jgi:hypothetical protein